MIVCFADNGKRDMVEGCGHRENGSGEGLRDMEKNGEGDCSGETSSDDMDFDGTFNSDLLCENHGKTYCFLFQRTKNN